MDKYDHVEPKPGQLTEIDQDADCYNMNHFSRGKAVIFNHYKFDQHANREGTSKDCEDITKVLTDLKFGVECYDDLKYGQIMEILAILSNMDHSDADCLMVIVMTHGDHNILYAKDHQYPPSELWEQFSGEKCPTLAGKPKLFFIQACRGDETDAGVEVTNARVQRDYKSQKSYKVPTKADLLVMFSTYPGHFSFRSPSEGAWFIQCLCIELKNRARKDDVLRILTFVNRRMGLNYESYVPTKKELHKKKQVGTIFCTFTRLLYFYEQNESDSKMETA